MSEAGGKQKLTRPQARRLEWLKAIGWCEFTPSEPVPMWARRLIAKGYAKEIPGLLDGCPQGVAPIE